MYVVMNVYIFTLNNHWAIDIYTLQKGNLAVTIIGNKITKQE